MFLLIHKSSNNDNTLTARKSISTAFILAILIVITFSTPLSAQSPPRSPRSGKNTASVRSAKTRKPFWRLRVSPKAPYIVTLRAINAPLTDVAADLSRLINAPVVLSTVMNQQRVNLNFNNLPLESAIRLLAPQAFIEYELSGGSYEPQICAAIYLAAYNEEPPADSIAVRNNVQTMIIAGEVNFDEAVENQDKAAQDKAAQSEPRNPVEVNFERGQLSVKARQQPLALVMSEIAEKINVPFDMQYATDQMVDVNFKSFSLEDAIRSLPAIARLYVRLDLQSYETKPLRLVLAIPSE